MTLTVDLAEEAVWEDGSPITAADLQCTWRAHLNTPGSIETTGWDRIVAVDEGASPKQAVIEFSSVYGPYKDLFNKIIKAAAVENCDDVSGDFGTSLPISGRPVMLESWGEDRSTIVANPNYWGYDTMVSDSVVMVAQSDQRSEAAALAGGQVDFIYPQFTEAIGAALQPDGVEAATAAGGDYEALYFQQNEGPLGRSDLPRGVLEVDRPPGAVRRDLRPDLCDGRRGRRAPELRPDRGGPVLPRRHLPEHVRPGRCRNAAHRQWLGAEQRRSLGEGRRRP
jgi:peptide/nickel transport system substrate-binding protein